MKKKLMVILGVLFVLLPLGLISEYSAWGEWDSEKYKEMIGFIPEGIKNAKTISIIPDYGEGSVLMYYLSAIIGGVILYAIFYLLSKKNVTN
jgi:ABC-type cobalt transport system substrate-binding protein